MEPTATVDKRRLIWETLRVYAHEAWQYPRLLMGAFMASILYTLGEDIVMPLLLARLVDRIIQTPPNFHAAYLTFWLIVAVAALDFISARLSFLFRNPSLSGATRNISIRIFKSYEEQEYSFFTNSYVGSLVARSNRFINTFKDLYDAVLFPGTALVLQIVVPIFILSHKSVLLGGAFLIATLAMVIITVGLGRYKTPHLRRAAAADSRVTGALADMLTNSLAVKVFARRRYEDQRFSAIADERRALFDKQTFVSERIRAARSLTVSLFQITIAFLLVRLTQEKVITVGTILLAQLYLTKLVQSLWNMNRIVERIEESLADAAEMTEVMIRQPAVRDPDKPRPFLPKAGRVDIENVGFAYVDSGPDQDALFNGFNLHIAPGQKVGLVGPSGGGKSTFTKVLLRFMDVDTGRVLIDGSDIKQVKQDDLRAHIAYVPQEPVLFHRSIRENIAYGNPQAGEAEIIKTAQLAHAHDFIMQLPQRYDTLVGERGVKLSGGEKQRVAIARAMLKKAPLLILDEATSALDSKSEKAIVAALDNLMKNRTTIVIAHRLSTIRKLDRIIVLKEGHLVEDGSHDQLLKSKGVYADLWAHQSGEFLPS